LLSAKQLEQCTAKPSWQQVWGLVAADIQTICTDVTQFLPIPPRDLERLLLLHLPRFEANDIQRTSTIRSEAVRLLEEALLRRRNYEGWAKYDKITEFVKHDLSAIECSDETAQVIYERFHYIGGCRKGIVHLGLYHQSHPDVPMALMTLSEMDIVHLRGAIGLDGLTSLVVSRSFAFDWAPRNSLSFLTSRVRQWLRNNIPEVGLLLTYVNPNLGFRGTSYDASGWWEFGSKDTIYRYLRDKYLSYRMMLELTPEEQQHTTTSRVQLAPLRILATKVKR
jgi:hypothetical protein